MPFVAASFSVFGVITAAIVVVGAVVGTVFPTDRLLLLRGLPPAWIYCKQLKQLEKAAPLLEKAIAAANQIQDSSNKTDTLSAIAVAAANLKNWGQALEATQKCPREAVQ